MARSADRRQLQMLAPDFTVIHQLVTATSEVIQTGAYKVHAISLTTDGGAVTEIHILDGATVKYDGGAIAAQSREKDNYSPGGITFSTNISIQKGAGDLRVTLYASRII